MASPARALAAALAITTTVSACRDDSGRSAAGDAGHGAPGPSCGPGDVGAPAPTTPHPVSAVQLAALGDSARAAALRDSLARQGWVAYLRAADSSDVRDSARVGAAAQASQPGEARWRVRVAPTSSAGLARRVAFNLRQLGREAVVVPDTAVEEMPTRRVISVSGNSQGMTARVRWVRSRDRCALLVVHDPTAIENDPLPNAFAFVSEWGPIVVRRDSVWDVAPDPAWERLAFSRAYVVSAGGRDSLSAAEWQLLARRSGMSVEDVRRAAFPTSGMAMAYGIARPAVLDVRGARGDSADRRRADGIASPAGAARDTVERLLPLLGGWRLGWTRDGRALAVGGAPRTTYDDAPSVEWQMVDPSTGATIGPSPGPAPLPAGDTLAAVRWREGPVLDISVPVDLSRRRGLSTAGYRIETRDGWIHLTAPGTRRGAASRIIGPGVALATTTHARFIVALVPREKAREFDAPLELVVYQVGE